mgnify:CR=1 FL=1
MYKEMIGSFLFFSFDEIRFDSNIIFPSFFANGDSTKNLIVDVI